MGIAAYNRASSVIAKRIAADAPTHHELFVSDLNRQPKYPDAGQAPDDLIFTFSRGVWWVNAASKPDGFGYYYRSIREAVRRWRVAIIGPDARGRFIGIPIPKDN